MGSRDLMFHPHTDETAISREKNRARELRRSSWWKRKLQDGICYYCGGRFESLQLTMDHLVPLARGGKSTRSNCVCACKTCNNRKKYMLPIEWEEYLASLETSEGDAE